VRAPGEDVLAELFDLPATRRDRLLGLAKAFAAFLTSIKSR
jgi:hypothetical protein